MSGVVLFRILTGAVACVSGCVAGIVFLRTEKKRAAALCTADAAPAAGTEKRKTGRKDVTALLVLLLSEAVSAAGAVLTAGRHFSPESVLSACLFSACMFGASVSDRVDRTVKNTYACAAALCGLSAGGLSGLPVWVRAGSAAAVFLFFLVFNLISRKKPVGGADVKLCVSMAFFSGHRIFLPALASGLLLAAVCEGGKRVFRKRKKTDVSGPFPLVPYLYAGWLTAFALNAVLAAMQ